MSRESLRLSPRLRWGLYLPLGVLLVTGVLWLVFHKNEASGEEPSAAWEPWLMRIHGGAAMVTLVVAGSLLPLHVWRGWKARRNRFSGVLIFSCLASLAVSGYGLYYAGGERLRQAIVYVHDGAGLALPAILLGHVLLGRLLWHRRRTGRLGASSPTPTPRRLSRGGSRSP